MWGGVTGSYRQISCSLKSYRKVIYKVLLKSTRAAAAALISDAIG